MPGMGEQHNYTKANPFDEVKPLVSEYTAADIATLSSRLEKQLGPEYISSRVGPGGGRVYYLSADKCINLANEVFGFNGWSSSIQNVQIDFLDETDQGKVSLGLSVTLRVTLRDGTYHEDIGYGHIENCKGKAAAFEKAKKEGTTDALKRALRNFGNLLGNCVYDKEYVAKVSKLKVPPVKWDPENLYRHPDFAPFKKEPSREQSSLPQLNQKALAAIDNAQVTVHGAPEDEFGSDDFEAVDFAASNGDHPDEIMLDTSVSSNQSARKPELLTRKSPSRLGNRDLGNVPKVPSTSLRPGGPLTPDTSQQRPKPPPPLFQQSNMDVPRVSQPYQNQQNTCQQSQNDPSCLKSSTSSEHEPPFGFFTARAAESIQAGSNPATHTSLFNPHLESPSIRKTASVDHTRTKPINRELIETAQPPSPATSGPVLRGNIVNPQTEKARRVGMPAGPGSPFQSRGSYKPPQLKRPVDGGALRNVTAASIDAGDVVDNKRRKVTSGTGLQNNDGTLKV